MLTGRHIDWILFSLFGFATRPRRRGARRRGRVVHRAIPARFAAAPAWGALHYTWIARRRGWKGEVHLAMRVGTAGRVSGLRVVGTSSYPVLDRAALRNARRIRTVSEAARWLRGHAVDIVVPVEYCLVNG